MAYKSLSELGASANKKSGRSGLLTALIGKSGFDPLGLGHAARTLSQAPLGLAKLATSLAPGGEKSLAPQALRGLGSSVLGTVETVAPGSQTWIKPVSRSLLGDEYEAKPLWERAAGQGLAMPLIEDIGNLALAGGAVESLSAQAGNAATKASILGRAVSKAEKIGADTGALSQAVERGTQLGAEGRYLGPFSSGLKEAGLRHGVLRDVAKASARLERAGGAEAAQAARASRIEPVAATLAHPYKELGSRLIRPLTRAGQAAEVAQTAPGAAAASSGFADDLARAYTEEHGLAAPEPVDAGLKVRPDKAKAVAKAYAEGVSNPADPAVRSSYQALANETKRQLDFLERQGVNLEFHDRPESGGVYGSAEEMIADAQSGRLKVDRTGPGEEHLMPEMNEVIRTDEAGRPVTVNDAFRAIHDYFGHSRAGNGFDRNGEEVAYRLHRQMFSPEAQPALATETRGQNSFLNFAEENLAREKAGQPKQFPEQKAMLLPEDLRAPYGTVAQEKAAALAKQLEALGARAPKSGPVREALLAAAGDEVPAWAQRAVEGRLAKAQPLLSKAEGRIQGWQAKQLFHETRRFMEAERRRVLASDAVQHSVLAANRLTDEFQIPASKASRMVGDQLMAELDNRDLLMATRRLFPDNEELQALVDKAVGRDYPMTGEQLLSVRPLLDKALAEWDQMAGERFQMLLGSPERGAEGLQEAIAGFNPAEAGPELGLSPKNAKRLNQLLREYETLLKSDTVEGRAAKARQRMVLGAKSKLDRAVADLDRVRAGANEARQRAWDSALPDTLKAANRTATVERLQEILGGGTYDPWTDMIVTAEHADASVGVAGDVIPRAEWEANPAAAFDAFVNRHATVLNDQDAKVGIWANGDNVYLDVSQTTIGGKRISREQALVLGMARGEQAVWDFAKGSEAWIPQDEVSIAVATQHAVEVMKPGSQFNRLLRGWSRARNTLAELQATTGNVKVDAASWDAKLQVRMRISAKAVEVGRYPSLDAAYGNMAVEAAATQRNPLGAMLQVYLAPGVEAAMQSLPEDWNNALRQMGDDGKKALDWYFDGYDTVASRWDETHTTSLPRRLDDGTWEWREINTRDLVWSIMAVTSTNNAPLPNAGAAFDGITAWSEYMRQVAPAKVADVVQEYQKAVLDARKKYGNGTKFTKDLPEMMASDLWDKVATAIPHTGSVVADVLDILTERLVPEWTNEWLFDRLSRKMPETIAEAKKLLGGKHEIPANYEGLVAEARAGSVEAEGQLRDLFGSKGYAKIRNFFANLAEPQKNRGVTLDRVMAQAFGLGSEDWSGAVYDRVVNMVAGLADDLSEMYDTEILPHQVQAIRWVAGKHEMSAIELGRRQAVYADALDLMAAGPDAAAAFAEGSDPISAWYAAELEFAQGAGEGKIAERTQKSRHGKPSFPQSGKTAERRAGNATARAEVQSAEVTERTFQSKISKGEEFDQLQRSADEWAKKRGKISDALAAGKRQTADDLIDSWIAGQQSAFNQPAQYFSDYASADTSIRGLGEKIAESARRAQRTDLFGGEGKVLPEAAADFQSPSGVPAAGLPELGPEQLAELQRRGQARWEAMAGVEADAMAQAGDDLANGLTFLGDKSGRITERFFRTADPTTLLHEEAHVLRLMLPKGDIKTLLAAFPGEEQAAATFGRRKITPPGQTLAGQSGKLVGKFGPRGFEEWFAESAIRYFNTAEAPPGLGNVFAKVRDALASWWQGSGDAYTKAVDPTVAELLNRWFDPVQVENVGAPKLGRDLAVPAGKADLYKFAQAEKARPGETAQQSLKRGLKLGRDSQRAADLAAQVATQEARVAKMQQAFADLPDKLAEMTLPAEAKKAARMARLEGQIGRLNAKGEAANLADSLPPSWKPLAGAVDNLRELAKQPGMEPLAEMMADIPDSLTGFLEYAVERGFDPTHVASIPESRVKSLVFGRIAPGDEAIVAGTRKARKGAMPLDRSIEALAAAHIDVVREAQTGQFLQTIRDTMAVPVVEGQDIPRGWVEWDQVRRYMGVETDVETGVRKAVAPGAPRYMVPEAVANTVRHMAKNYDFGILRGIRKVTSPWRTFVLTLSPKWYVNNIVGNMILASAGGVSLSDWVSAWRAYRKGAHQGRWLEQRFGPGTEAFTGPESAVVGGANILTDQVTGSETLGEHVSFREARAQGHGKLAAAKHAKDATLNKLSRFNTVVDDIARSAVYLSGEAKGLTPEAALAHASKVMVDYNDLGPVERSLVRSVVPFYAWQKGILKVVGRMAIDHPARVGMMYQLGQLNDELMADLPEYYRQQLGGFNVRPFNPFADAASILTPNGIAQSVNPFLDQLVRSAYDAPETGYPEEYRVDEFGRAMPSVNPLAGSKDVLAGLPQLRGVGVGNDNGLAASLGGFFGLPQQRPADQLNAARLRLRKANAKVAGMTPTEAGITKPKKQQGGGQFSSGYTRPRLSGLG